MDTVLYRRFTLIAVCVAVAGILAAQSVQHDMKRAANNRNGVSVPKIVPSPHPVSTGRCGKLHCSVVTERAIQFG